MEKTFIDTNLNRLQLHDELKAIDPGVVISTFQNKNDPNVLVKVSGDSRKLSDLQSALDSHTPTKTEEETKLLYKTTATETDIEKVVKALEGLSSTQLDRVQTALGILLATK